MTLKRRNIIQQLDFCMEEAHNPETPKQLREDYIAISRHLIGEIDLAAKVWSGLSTYYNKRLDVYQRKN